MRRQIPCRAVALASLLCALVAPAVADANRPLSSTGTTTTGGAGLGAGGTKTSTGIGTTSTPTSTPLPPEVIALTLGTVIWASGNGITIGVTGSALHGNLLTFTGTAPAADADSTALIRYASATAPDGWVQVAQAQIGANGEFAATWKAQIQGLLDFTVTLVTPNAVPAADPSSATLVVQVFNSSVATIYGPGLWGHKTACGTRLRRATLGVASRTVKCGTMVAVYYAGREIVVPVIDRGPFHSGAKWDLTEATAKALGVTETATVRTIEPWPRSPQLSALS